MLSHVGVKTQHTIPFLIWKSVVSKFQKKSPSFLPQNLSDDDGHSSTISALQAAAQPSYWRTERLCSGMLLTIQDRIMSLASLKPRLFCARTPRTCSITLIPLMKPALHENNIGTSYLRRQACEPVDLWGALETLEAENLVRAESVWLEARPQLLYLGMIK